MASTDDELNSGHHAGDRSTSQGAGDEIDPAGTTWPTEPPVFSRPILPKRIGRYAIEAEIGSGGMGRVYAARDERLDRAVAVKVVRSGMSSASALDRFLAESRLLARIEHPGIARVFDCGVDDSLSLPYFVMERVPGAQTLTSFADRVSMEAKDKLRLFERVCEAVQAAHRLGIVHRDLKPNNILVASGESAATAQPKVIDFGIAEEVRPEVTASRGGPVGTLEYMSPEQCQGGPVDARSDVYGLGMVLYQLLSGRLPYSVPGDGMTAESTRIIREARPTPLGLQNPAFRGDLEAIVQRALEKAPEERYQSVAAFRKDIHRYLEGQPVEARSRNVAYVAARRAASAWKRHPWIALCVTTLAAYCATESAAVSLVYEYTPLDKTYAALLTLVPAAARLGPTLSKTAIITLPDSSDVRDAAARANIRVEPEGGTWPTPTPENSPPPDSDGQIGAFDVYAVSARRLLIAQLLDRLVEVRPSVVALDLMIMDQPPADDWARAFEPARQKSTRALAAAANRLRIEGGRAVVGGLPTWSDPTEAAEMMSPGIEKSMYWGGLTVSLPPRQTVLDLFVDRQGQPPIPSLALEAFARRDGNTTSRPSIVPGSRRVSILYPSAMDGPTGVTRATRKADSIAVSRCDEPVMGDDAESRQMKPSDRVGMYVAELPDDAFFTSASLTITRALEMPLEELTRHLRGKAVIVARVGTDLQTTDDGREVAGCWAHAAGLESLLTNKGIIAPDRLESHGLILAGCVLGAWAGGAQGRRMRALRSVLVTLGMVGGSLGAYHYAGFQFNPMVPLVSALFAGVLRFALVPPAAGRPVASFVGISV